MCHNVRATRLKDRFNLPQPVEVIATVVEDTYPIKKTLENQTKKWLFEMFTNISYDNTIDYVHHFRKIRNFTGSKSENFEWFVLLYGEKGANERLLKKSERIKGTKNPAYNHNGMYSKWSNNFVHGYDKEAHEIFKKEQSTRMKNNRRSKWCREYYSSDVEYSNAQKRNLDYFIEKYGVDEGTARHNLKTQKWQNTLQSKYGVEYTKKMHVLSCQNYRKSMRENFTKNVDSLIYFLDVGNDKYKIGITTKSVEQRYSRLGKLTYNIIYQRKTNLRTALSIECKIKKRYAIHSIQKNDSVSGFGWTETFSNCNQDEIIQFIESCFCESDK